MNPMPFLSSYVTKKWDAATANWDIFEGQAEVPSANIGTIVDKVKTWNVGIVHHAFEPTIQGIITPWRTLAVSFKSNFNLQDTTKRMLSFSSYATNQATENWDIFKGQVSSITVGNIVDKVNTWILSMVDYAREPFSIATQGIISLLHKHPYTALVISTLISFPGAIFMPPILLCAVCTPVLACLGFCAGGIAGGSIAAGIQGAYYGAAVPAGGLFATMQSLGATMGASIPVMLSRWILLVLWLISCAVWIYVVFGILLR